MWRPAPRCRRRCAAIPATLMISTAIWEAGEQSGALETIYDRIAIYREKARSPQIQDQEGHVLSVHGHSGGHRRHLHPAALRHSPVRGYLQELRCRAARLYRFVITISRFMQGGGTPSLAARLSPSSSMCGPGENPRRSGDNTDKFILTIPVVGNILHKAAMARFARTLSTTFSAGIPLVDALVSAAGASGKCLSHCDHGHSQRGGGRHADQRRHAHRGSFPDMVTQMVMIGEESGAIDDMLSRSPPFSNRKWTTWSTASPACSNPSSWWCSRGAGRRHGRGHVPPHFQAGLCDTLTPRQRAGRYISRPSVIPVPDTSD